MNYRKLPGIYDIENGEKLLECVRNGDTLSFEKMVLGHTRIAARIVNSLVNSWKLWHLRDDLDSVAYVAIVTAVNNIREGRMQHDDFTSYIACCIRGYVGHEIKKAKKYAPMNFELYHGNRDIWVIDVLDEIYSVCKNDTERSILDLRIQRYTDAEISATLGCDRSRVTQIRRELKSRFTRKARKNG